MLFGETIPLNDGDTSKYKIWCCIGDIDVEEAFPSGESE